MSHIRSALLVLVVVAGLASACARRPEALPINLETIRGLSAADTQEIRVEDKGAEILVTIVDKHGDGHIHSLELDATGKVEALEILSRKQAELRNPSTTTDQ